MGHRISRPLPLDPPSRGLLCYVAATLIVVSVISSSPQTMARAWSMPIESHLSQRSIYHMGITNAHHDYDGGKFSARWSSCFVKAATPSPKRVRKSHLLGPRLPGALGAATATFPSEAAVDSIADRRDFPDDSSYKGNNNKLPFRIGKPSDRRHSTSRRAQVKRQSESYKLSPGGDLNFEPVRLKNYNEVARREKRQKHLLRLVRSNKAHKSQLQNEARIKVVVPADSASHEVTGRRCLVLRKDEEGKIRTFWQSEEYCSPTMEDKTDCYSIDHNEEVEVAKIPKPLMRSSEAEMYAATDVSTLRKLFGRNKNWFWGDLDPETTRMLYHTLLPRALLRLHAQGLTPNELAPLAFEARCAAKQYARERCRLPGRLASMAFDGIRHVKNYGKWSSKGLSWEQIWDKYEQQVLSELLHSMDDEEESDGTEMLESVTATNLKDLTSLVCVRILQRSCATNQLVDRVVMSHGTDSNGKKRKKSEVAREVLAVANKFDQEIHELLNKKDESTLRAKEFILKRTAASLRKKLRGSGIPFNFSYFD